MFQRVSVKMATRPGRHVRPLAGRPTGTLSTCGLPEMLRALLRLPDALRERYQEGLDEPGHVLDRAVSMADHKENTKGVSDLIANPSYCLVAGARNHLPANRPLEFSFEIAI